MRERKRGRERDEEREREKEAERERDKEKKKRKRFNCFLNYFSFKKSHYHWTILNAKFEIYVVVFKVDCQP